jgi:hypothetical protein
MKELLVSYQCLILWAIIAAAGVILLYRRGDAETPAECGPAAETGMQRIKGRLARLRTTLKARRLCPLC